MTARPLTSVVYCLGMLSILSIESGMKPGTIHFTRSFGASAGSTGFVAGRVLRLLMPRSPATGISRSIVHLAIGPRSFECLRFIECHIFLAP